MGADLCLALVAIPKEVEPDWQAARDWVAGLTIEDLEIRASDLCWEGEGEELRSQMYGLLDEFKVAIDGPVRDVMILEVADHYIYVSGGMTWGDDPTDAFGILNDAASTDLAEAAGFGERLPMKEKNPLVPILVSSRGELIDTAIALHGEESQLVTALETAGDNDIAYIIRKASDRFMDLIGDSYSDVLEGEAADYLKVEKP